jgi:methionine-rich copper-binding protein CopC
MTTAKEKRIRTLAFGGAPGFGRTLHRTELKLDLLENGIDFIRSGIEEFFRKDRPAARAHKYAVLHIFAGILLLLKERLCRAHPALMFSKVERMDQSGAIPVNFDEAISRLPCAGVKLSDNQMATLRAAQKTRNELEHFKVALKLKEAQELVGSLCEFVFVFLRDELGTNLADHLRPAVWRRVVELRGIAKEIEKERWEEWRQRAEKYMKLSADALERLWNERPQYHPKHNPDVPDPLWCPECGEERVLWIDYGDIAVCTNPRCGEVLFAGRCLRCGEVILGEDEGFCDDCTAYIASD